MIKHITTIKDNQGLANEIVIEASGDDFEALTGEKPAKTCEYCGTKIDDICQECEELASELGFELY